MEDEQEDVKKMTDFINQQKSNYQNTFQLEFQDFINFKQEQECSDQEFEDEIFETEQNPNYKRNTEEVFTESTQEVGLTEEEKSVIESCSDPDLKTLLILNRSKNMQLIKLHKKMQDLLIQCEKEIEDKQANLQTSDVKPLGHQTCVWKLAAPYFKDKKFFACPLNDDAAKKRAREELSIYDLVQSPKWNPIEFDRLTNAIKCNYNINRQNDTMSKLARLKTKMGSGDYEDKSKIEQILDLKEELEKLKKENKVPPLNSNEFIDWYKVAETFLRDKHTATECQSVWHMLVHPLINKSEWSEEENQKLETIAKSYSYQNWEKIVFELNTNRTGFTTCLHYYSKLCDKFKRSKFTPEEDSFIMEVVDIYKIGNFIPWNKVVYHFTNRSRHQLYHRYTYFLSQNHVKRGKFSEAEDILLIILVNKFGRNFKKCAEYMPHRSQVQLKSRYNSNLQRHIKKGAYTSEDDQMIYDYAQKHGEKSWSGLTQQLNRCNAQIRLRYRLIKTFLGNHPNATVSDIPKRKHRFDDLNENQHDFLNYMARQFKDLDYVPTVSMIEECLQVELETSSPAKTSQDKATMKESDAPEGKLRNIDSILTDFFSSSMKVKQWNVVTETSLNEAADNASEMLKLLGADLTIPKDLECDEYLDNVDIEILERISNRNGGLSPCNSLMSPNISTLVGLKSLIIKHKAYKSQQKENNSGNKLVETKEPEISLHRDLFSKRFDILFNWSAVLSLETPNQLSISEKNSSVTKRTSSQDVSQVKKRTISQDATTVKKRKIDVSALTHFSQNAKDSPHLKLVDKSVVENLIRNKSNLNIIRIETIIGADGVVKPVINTSRAVSKPSPRIIELTEEDPVDFERNIEIVKHAVDDEDVQDVERLNTALKTMKSEANNDPLCLENEDRAINDDVNLLQQILLREKAHVKPDPDGF